MPASDRRSLGCDVSWTESVDLVPSTTSRNAVYLCILPITNLLQKKLIPANERPKRANGYHVKTGQRE